MLVHVSYKATTLTPEIFTVCICLIMYLNMHNIGRFLQRRRILPKSSKFACSHSFSNFSSEEVSWKRFQISSPVRATSLSSVTIATSSSWTSVVATVGVGYHTGITVFTGLLRVVLGPNCTVFLPIAEI